MVAFSSRSSVSRWFALAAAAALICSLPACTFDFWAAALRLGSTAASTATATTAFRTTRDAQAEQLAVPIRTDTLTGRDAGIQSRERRHPDMGGPERLGQAEHGAIVDEGWDDVN